ncbi:hypothetical protein L2E82_22511 [Cichorium intybus]|uniref:Uncharacterized protein n=1 Tax=Cichorium intybus TaxID=13427 RepID=A0ACB9DXZ0_CICIN|nr:hypothetical protein L2E82_22511 [Cichorium intybus]
MTLGVVHDIRRLQVILRNLTNNLIFQEAYDMTGRVLGITVCSPRKHEPPRCHNYLTSPHVVIWSAVTASCSFPGLFEAQELMAKDRSGEIVPYHPSFHWGPEETKSSSTRGWRDAPANLPLQPSAIDSKALEVQGLLLEMYNSGQWLLTMDFIVSELGFLCSHRNS